MKKLTLLLVLIMVLTSVVGCGSGKGLSGTWKVVGLEEGKDYNENNMAAGLQMMLISMIFGEGSNLEFIDDNKLSVMGQSVDYELLKGDKIQIGNENDSPVVFDYKIKGDKMYFDGIANVTFEKVN